METGSNKPALTLAANILASQSQPGAITGVSNTPFAFKGTAVSVHSPVELHVYDAANNHTGPTQNGEFETKIPGSFYDTTGESKYVFLPNDGQYRFVIQGTDTGTFDLKVQNYQASSLATTALYRDVPTTSTAKATALYNTADQTPPALQLDANGDGVIEQTLNASSQLTGAQALDTAPPKTTVNLQGSTGQNSWYRSDVTVQLTAADETNGSGLLKTEYSLDDGKTVQEYTKPLVATQSATVKFRSIDKTGNEEPIQTLDVKIDKIPPEASINFDPKTQDFAATGKDDGSGIAQVTTADSSYTISDLAGNTLTINLQDKDHKKSEKVIIKELVYNGTIVQAIDNNFHVAYALDKKDQSIKELEQEIKLKGIGKIVAHWNGNKDKTTVVEKEVGEKRDKQVLGGLTLLKLETNAGQLLFSY